MINLKKQTPYGVQDYLQQECYNKRLVEQKVLNCLLLAGYDQLQTPTFEFYDVFGSGNGGIKEEKLLKFVSDDGKILVLRPDMTMPLARVAATKLTQFPARLCYVGQAFGCENAYFTDQREFTQVGVELLGVPGDQADAEVIALAISALQAAGLKRFIIDMGQVEFFKGLMEEAGLTPDQSEQLREYIDQKNDVAVELFLRKFHIHQDIKEKIMQLSTLYGGAEVFEQAYRFSTHPRCRAAVQNLSRVYDILKDFGFEQYISVDLGMLQSIDYYSGCIFKGISQDIGCALLSGGRYDNLLAQFGAQHCATGFALGIKRTLIALERQDALAPLPKIDCVLSCDSRARKKAYETLCALRKNGTRTVSAFELDQAQLQAYADTLGARALYVCDSNEDTACIE